MPPTSTLRTLLEAIREGTVLALDLVALMVFWRLVLRTDRAVLTASALVVALFSFFTDGPLALQVVQATFIGIGSVWLVRRFGLLALAAGLAVNIVVRFTPWTLDVTKWFAWRPIMTTVIVLVIALWGFRNVLGRQPAFPKLALD